jgi:hypothetical protein
VAVLLQPPPLQPLPLLLVRSQQAARLVALCPLLLLLLAVLVVLVVLLVMVSGLQPASALCTKLM